MVQSYEKFSIIVPFRIIFLNYLCKKQQKSGAEGESLNFGKGFLPYSRFFSALPAPVPLYFDGVTLNR